MVVFLAQTFSEKEEYQDRFLYIYLKLCFGEARTVLFQQWTLELETKTTPICFYLHANRMSQTTADRNVYEENDLT